VSNYRELVWLTRAIFLWIGNQRERPGFVRTLYQLIGQGTQIFPLAVLPIEPLRGLMNFPHLVEPLYLAKSRAEYPRAEHLGESIPADPDSLGAGPLV
jgi:hypothetical protein